MKVSDASVLARREASGSNAADSSEEAIAELFGIDRNGPAASDALRRGPLIGGVDEQEAFDQRKLRKYQRERLRYFYAIAEFDSPETASAVRTFCHGLEIEATGNQLELRVVPDDTTFDDREPREHITELPATYEPPKWTTRALGHSQAQLTWDEDDPDRATLTQRQWSVDDLVNEEQFHDLLPGEESGSEFSSAGGLASGTEDDEEAVPSDESRYTLTRCLCARTHAHSVLLQQCARAEAEREAARAAPQTCAQSLLGLAGRNWRRERCGRREQREQRRWRRRGVCASLTLHALMLTQRSSK